MSVVEPTPTNDTPATKAISATEAEMKRISTLRAQVGILEQQLRGTEARVRDSEKAREMEKNRHDKEVRNKDAQLATISRGIKESRYVKDQVLGECRQWRRKAEDLEDLQRLAQINPVRGMQGRTRWAPAKKYGVRKGNRTRPDKEFTAVAQVAIVNAAWESKMVSFENEARAYVARTADQIRSLNDAATALSNENAFLRQQIQATSGISHELAQQQMGEAVRSALVNAEQQHEERVKLLKQTHLGELTAVKVDYEGKLTKATAESKAEAETALSQQREVGEGAAQHALATKEAQLGELRATLSQQLEASEAAAQETSSLKQALAAKDAQLGELRAALSQQHEAGEGAAQHALAAKEAQLGEMWTALSQQREVSEGAVQETNSLKHALATQEAQLGELLAANAMISAELQASKEEQEKLDGDMEVETSRVVQYVQERDGAIRAGKKLQEQFHALQEQYEELRSSYSDLAVEKAGLEVEIGDLKEAVSDLADQGEAMYQEVEGLEGNNRALANQNSELFCQSLASDMELQQTRDKVGNLERQVTDYQTAEAADITSAVSGMGFNAE